RNGRAAFEFARAVYDRTLRPEHLSHLVDELTTSSVHAAPEQAADIAAAVRCARERGDRFVFVQDLLLSDLVAGRSANRRTLLERRRDAVAADGRAVFFIDALDAFQSEAGVSWFNDIRHLSLIGHRRFAEQICSILTG